MSFLDTISAALRWSYVSFGFRERTDTLPSHMAVCVMQPTDDHNTMALDLAPGPLAVPNADNGLTWFDLCSTSVVDNPTSSVFTLRLGVKPNAVEIGSRAFNGAGIRALHLIQDRTVAMRIELDGSNQPLITCYGPVRAPAFVTIPSLAGAQP